MVLELEAVGSAVSAQRAKGTRFETAILPWLQQLWPKAERTGSRDYAAGDFANTGWVVVEAKNQKRLDFNSWLKQAKAAGERLGKLPIVIANRERKSIGESYVVMELDVFVRLLRTDNGEPYIQGFSDGITEGQRNCTRQHIPVGASRFTGM